jgi:uncharacterized protein
MDTLKKKYGKTALIAGASEGIGAAYAECLAKEGINLLLVARRLELLQEFAGKLQSIYGIKTTCISCDLSDSNAAVSLEKELRDTEINILVYNAALSFIGPYLENSIEEKIKMAQVNMLTPMTLVHLFGEKMITKQKGAIVLMASMAAFQGSGYLSVYGATKAFNRILGESLWYEWKDKGVDVIACCAGATSTPNYLNSNPEKNGIFAPRVLTPGEVAGECLSKLGKQPSWIPGRGNRIASFFMQKFMTRKAAVSIMGGTTKKMYRL